MSPRAAAPGRRAFLFSASAVLLAGCGDLLGPPAASQIYLLRPEFPPAAAGPKAGWSLAVMRPSAPAALEGLRIAIAKPDATLDYYAEAQFPDSAPALVQDALVHAFEASGRLEGVGREQDALHADYDLFIEMQNFEARYAVPDGIPQGVVTLTAKLATAHGRAIVGSFTTSQATPAAANSVAAATHALQQSLVLAANAVVGWALGFPQPPKPPQR